MEKATPLLMIDKEPESFPTDLTLVILTSAYCSKHTYTRGDMSTVRLEHPTLGVFNGVQGDGVEQFFGIQYATLKDRFAEPVVRTEYDGEVDATKHG